MFPRDTIEKGTLIYYLHTDPLADRELFAGCFAAVPRERRDKVMKYRFERDRRLSLAAGFLLQQLDPDEAYCHNISHSGTYAVLALSRQKVGVDIEKIVPQKQAVAEHFFHRDEILYLRERKENFDEEFTRIWTRKEAYVKALGTGLATPLDSFSVLDKGTLTGEDGIPFRIESFDSIPGYQLSVCCRDPEVFIDNAAELFLRFLCTGMRNPAENSCSGRENARGGRENARQGKGL